MASRFEEQARWEGEQQDGFRLWREECITLIHAQISASDVLQRNGVKLRYSGQRPEQIFCPFHGNTKTMAARYHPSDNRNPDHVWCFACNPKRPWDAITLFGKFAEYTGKFTGLLRIIARDYGIPLPEVATGAPDDGPAKQALADAQAELDVCERRLRRERPAFDMRSYLILGSVLDKLAYGIDAGTQPLSKAMETISLVHKKIGEKSLHFNPNGTYWTSLPTPTQAEINPLVYYSPRKGASK